MVHLQPIKPRTPLIMYKKRRYFFCSKMNIAHNLHQGSLGAHYKTGNINATIIENKIKKSTAIRTHEYTVKTALPGKANMFLHLFSKVNNYKIFFSMLESKGFFFFLLTEYT